MKMNNRIIDFEQLIEDGYLDEYALRLDTPPFDDAIIGTDHNGRLVYSLEKMICDFAKENNCSEWDAAEFIDYNTIRSLPYFGDMAPVIMYDITDYYVRLENV